MRKLTVVLLVCIFAAVVFAAGERIRSVTVTGASGAALTRAQRAIKARPGDLYQDKILQDDVVALLDLPFVRSARARQSTSPDGIDVVYEIETRGAVTGVYFTGNRKLKPKKLLREGKLEDFKYYDIARLTEARDLIIEKYKKLGYLFAKVDFASQPDGAVLFTVREGKRLKVTRVNVIGNTAFDDDILRKKLLTKTRKYLLFPFRLDENILEEDRLNLQDFYRDSAYLDATVALSLNLTPNGKGIIIDLLVTEGPFYTVRSVSVTGNAAIDTAALLADLKMTSGKAFSPSSLDADVRTINSAYGRIGHIDAVITPSTIFALDAPEVDVRYRVEEGTAITIGEIDIFGNDKTRDSVIRRDLQFYPGETFDTDAFALSQRKLQRLAYFSSLAIAPEPAPPGSSPRNVAVTVAETPTGQFSIGAGVSSNTGLMAYISFNQRNFDYARPPRSFRDIVEGRAWAGGGQSFSLEAAPGSELSQVRMTFRNPRVNDSDYSFGLELHLWERERDTYTERRAGGGVSIGKQFTDDAFWEASFAADNVRVSSIKAWAPADVFAVRGTSEVNTVGLTLGHDTRDNFLMPAQGHRLIVNVENSNEIFASEFDFTRVRLDGNWYRTVRRDKFDRPSVLSWRTKVAHMFAGGDQNAPIFERYFVGGAFDVRGFEYRGIGPRQGGEPLGGKFLAVGGLQYEVPLVGDVFRGAVFYDAGTLLGGPADLTANEIRHTVGFGIRFIIPPPLNMPVLLDFGFALKDSDQDRTQVFSFSMGRSI